MSRNMSKNQSGSPILKLYQRSCLLAITALLACLLATTAGCNKIDELNKMAKDSIDEAKKKVGDEFPNVVETVTEQAGLAGNVNIKLDKDVTTKACYASLVEQSPDRPNVLKLQSYASPDTESIPSIFIQAQVGTSSLAELVGSEVSAQVFVQTQRDGEVWFTDPAESIQVKITALEDNMLTAELVSGKLHSTVSGNSVDADGTIEAVVQ